MVDHNIVRFDVSMDNLDSFMAIVKSFKHIHEIKMYILLPEADLSVVLRSTSIFTFLFVLGVDSFDIIAKTSLGVVFLNKIYVVLLRIVNNLL